MIIKSFVISNGKADFEVWTVSFRLYPDGLVINTGYSQNFIIDYVDIPSLKKGLLEISNDVPEFLVECSKDSDCLLKLIDDDIHIMLDDKEVIASFYYADIEEVIKVLDMVEYNNVN